MQSIMLDLPGETREGNRHLVCEISTATVDSTPPLSPCKDLSGGGSLISFDPKLGSRRYGWSGGKNLRSCLYQFRALFVHVYCVPSESSNACPCLSERSLSTFSHDFIDGTGCVVWCATAKTKIKLFSFLIRSHHIKCSWMCDTM